MEADTCEEWGAEVRQGIVDMEYYGGQAQSPLGPAPLKRERAELERFKEVGVYEYISREQVGEESTGKVGQSERGERRAPGDSVPPCGPRIQELGYGERQARCAPRWHSSLTIVKLLLVAALKNLSIMLLLLLHDVKFAFLHSVVCGPPGWIRSGDEEVETGPERGEGPYMQGRLSRGSLWNWGRASGQFVDSLMTKRGLKKHM